METKEHAWDALPGSHPVLPTEVTGCRWPLGHGHPFLFCDQPMYKPGTSDMYCLPHSKMAYTPRGQRHAG